MNPTVLGRVRLCKPIRDENDLTENEKLFKDVFSITNNCNLLYIDR